MHPMQTVKDEDVTLRARLLMVVLPSLVCIALVIAIVSLFVHSDPKPILITTAGLLMISTVFFLLVRRGKAVLVSILLTVSLWCFFTLVGVYSGGMSGAGPLNYFCVVTLAGLLLGMWAGLGFALASILATLGLTLAEANGMLPPVSLPSTSLSIWLTLGANLLLSSFFLGLAVRNARAALRQSRRSELELIDSNRALQLTQEQLLHAQKMEAVGRLAGGVAHDFNNLLTAIGGYASLLEMQIPANDPNHEDLNEIKAAAKRGAGLTRQLLAFSRKQVLQPQVISLNEIIAGMEDMLRRLIGEDIDVRISLSPELVAVKADPGQMEQIVLNLVLNARDAMPRGGRLTIETVGATLDQQYASRHAEVTPGEYSMLAVGDTGDGMDMEIQSRIFEPFFTTKQEGKGAGLGLSTVFGIVKQSDGHLRVYSEPGRGSTFKVYLPRVEEQAEVLGRSDEPKGTAGGKETILVVEDDQKVLSLVRRVLEESGYTVLAAAQADEAFRLSRSHEGSIDLLLTDVIMPGVMSGPDLARQLKRERWQITVLYMSGYTGNAIVHQGVLDPGVSFLGKPFTPELLNQKIREVLDEAVPS